MSNQNRFIAAIELARPKHWVKNGFVAIPILFGGKYSDTSAWLSLAMAFAAFCLASSAVYAFNDLIDADRDRKHPTKKNRPIPSGRLSRRWAAGQALLLGVLSLGLGYGVSGWLPVVIGGYLLLNAIYPLVKSLMAVDVVFIALGFVLRAVAGAVAVGVRPSEWLLVCTFLLCVFLGLCKRQMELQAFGGKPDGDYRPSLGKYNPELLKLILGAVAVLTWVTFASYTISPGTVQNFGTRNLIYTTPVAALGLWRFWRETFSGEYTDPTDLILKDRMFVVSVLAWLAACAMIVIRGKG